MTDEIWKKIVGFDGYDVSNKGSVRSYYKRAGHGKGWEIANEPQRILRGAKDNNGYPFVSLCQDGEQSVFRIHKLVMSAFVGPPPENMEVCHNNGNPQDNRLENLRYDTHRENSRDRIPLSKDEIIALAKRYKDGECIECLKSEFSLSGRYVSRLSNDYPDIVGDEISSSTRYVKLKLTDIQVEEIKKRKKEGESLSQLAKYYNCDPSYISLIVNGLRRNA